MDTSDLLLSCAFSQSGAGEVSFCSELLLENIWGLNGGETQNRLILMFWRHQLNVGPLSEPFLKICE